jgi:DNA-binding SARP family transcriptional activator
VERGVTVAHRVLGPVEMWADGRRVNLGYAQQRCVFAALLVDLNQVVPTGELVNRVWGEDRPRSAHTALYAYVARLRRAVVGTGGTRITRRGGGYVMEADPETVDLYRFRRLMAQARAADDERAADLFDQALELWLGPALAGLTGAWADAMRERAEAERLTAIADRNEAYLRTGRHGELIGDLTQLAAADPLDERVASQLMRALYRSGRQADALRCYHEIRHRLADELGIDPQPGLKFLYDQILHNDSALTVAVPPWRTRPHRSPAELPHDDGGFTGRAPELGCLHKLGTTPDVGASGNAMVSLSDGGACPLARLADGGRRVAVWWPWRPPEPVLSGDTATYRAVLPGVDLRVRATVDGFTGTVVAEAFWHAPGQGAAAVECWPATSLAFTAAGTWWVRGRGGSGVAELSRRPALAPGRRWPGCAPKPTGTSVIRTWIS